MVLSIRRGALPVKEPILLRFSHVVLGPHGNNDGISGVAWIKEYNRYITTGDHFAGGDPPGHGDVLQPHRYAAGDLDGGGVGPAVKCLQDSFLNQSYGAPKPKRKSYRDLGLLGVHVRLRDNTRLFEAFMPIWGEVIDTTSKRSCPQFIPHGAIS